MISSLVGMAAKDQKGRGLDIFKLLSTGTKFDKKRFSKHVNVFRSGRDERGGWP